MFGMEVEYLDHINGLDDAGGEHTGGTAINKGLDSGPNTNRFSLLLVSHLLRLKVKSENSNGGGEETKKAFWV